MYLENAIPGRVRRWFGDPPVVLPIVPTATLLFGDRASRGTIQFFHGFQPNTPDIPRRGIVGALRGEGRAKEPGHASGTHNILGLFQVLTPRTVRESSPKGDAAILGLRDKHQGADGSAGAITDSLLGQFEARDESPN